MTREDQTARESLVKSPIVYGSLPTVDETDESGNSENETPEKAKYTSTQWLSLITLGFANFCTGACVSLQAPFFPAEAEHKGATPTEYGFIFGIFQLTLFFMAPVMGKLVSYVSPKLVLNLGVLILGVTCVAFGTLDYCQTTTTFVALAFVIRTVEGVGAAALRTSIYTIIASQFIDGIGTTFASLETFLGLGLIIGPTMGGALYDAGGYGLPFFVVGAIVLVDAIIIYFVLPDVERKNVPKSGNLLKFWIHPLVLTFSLSIFSTFSFIGFTQATLEPHMRSFKLAGFYLGMIFALSGVVYGVSAPCWGWLIDHLCSSHTISVFGCLLQIFSLFFIGPVPFVNIEPAIYFIVPSLAVFGLALGSKYVSAFTGMLKESANLGLSPGLATYGLVSSIVASSQSLGAFAGPSFGGFLSQKFGFRTSSMAFFVLECILLFLFICFYFIRSCRSQYMDMNQQPNDDTISTSSNKELYSILDPEHEEESES